MNNEDFQKLVRDKAAPSSQEIARRAVEQEFRSKKRRHNDDSDSDTEQQPTARSVQQRSNNKKRQSQEDDKALTWKYRDRAKERRDGKLEDDNDDDWDNDLMMAPPSIVSTDAATAKAKPRRVIVARSPYPSDKAQALAMINNHTLQAQSSLGKELLQMWQQRTTARQPSVLLRTFYTFSLQADPRNKVKSWHIPTQYTTNTTADIPSKASRIDGELLGRVRKALLQRFETNDAPTKEQQQNEDSDEDDIFGTVGDDYIPPTTTNQVTAVVEGPESAKSAPALNYKPKLFDDAIVPPPTSYGAVATTTRGIDKPTETAASSSRLVGFLDVLQQGDGIDTDFDGRFDTLKKRKKKKRRKDSDSE